MSYYHAGDLFFCSLFSFIAGVVLSFLITLGAQSAAWQRETVGRGAAYYDIHGEWHWKEDAK
jgi:hypothetical protein